VVTLAAGPSSVGFAAPEGATAVAPTASGSTVTYPAVFPGVDLTYVVSSANLVKEELVLHAPPAGGTDATYRFPLRLTSGLVPRPDPDGGIGVYDAKGAEKYRIPPGTMMDSNVDPHSGNSASAPVQLTLDTAGTTPVVVVRAAGAWLADPARVYPVSVDPSWRAGLDGHWAGDTFASNRCGGCNYVAVWGSTQNRYEDDLGHYSGSTGTNRTYIEYDLGSVDGKQVVSATWNGYFMWNYWNTASTQYWIHPVAATTAWSPGGLTWNNQDQVAPRRGDTIVDSAARYQWRTVDMTGWAANWASGAWANSGIELDEGSHETDATYWKKLASSNKGDGSQSHLDITYASYASSYSFYNNASDPSSDPVNHPPFRGPAANTATTMPVYVENDGSETWTASNYHLSYHQMDSATTPCAAAFATHSSALPDQVTRWLSAAQ
jgi:hypothetical protein